MMAIHNKLPEIGSKVKITDASFNHFFKGEICTVTRHDYNPELFYVISKKGIEQLVDWLDCEPYTELLNSKETKMEQKSKWYKPWAWFAKKEETKAEEQIEPLAPLPTPAIYTPPRNIPKKRAVKKSKPAKKKQAVKRGKK